MFVSPVSAVLLGCALILVGLILGRLTARLGPQLGASLKRQRFNGVTVLDGALTGRLWRRAGAEVSVYFVVKRAPREAVSAVPAPDAAAAR